MSVTTAQRIAVFDQARTSWGEAAAIALMDMLPFDRDDLATKADIEQVRAEILAGTNTTERAIDALDRSTRSERDARIAEVRAEFHRMFAEQTRTLVLAMVATNLTGVTLAFTAARFA